MPLKKIQFHKIVINLVYQSTSSDICSILINVKTKENTNYCISIDFVEKRSVLSFLHTSGTSGIRAWLSSIESGFFSSLRQSSYD